MAISHWRLPPWTDYEFVPISAVTRMTRRRGFREGGVRQHAINFSRQELGLHYIASLDDAGLRPDYSKRIESVLSMRQHTLYAHAPSGPIGVRFRRTPRTSAPSGAQ